MYLWKCVYARLGILDDRPHLGAIHLCLSQDGALQQPICAKSKTSSCMSAFLRVCIQNVIGRCLSSENTPCYYTTTLPVEAFLTIETKKKE